MYRDLHKVPNSIIIEIENLISCSTDVCLYNNACNEFRKMILFLDWFLAPPIKTLYQIGNCFLEALTIDHITQVKHRECLCKQKSTKGAQNDTSSSTCSAPKSIKSQDKVVNCEIT